MGACGGADEGSDSAALGLSGGGSQEDIQKAYCDKFSKELCAARTKCCTSVPPDLVSCEQSVSIDCILSTGTQLHDGWVFSGERIDATLEALQTATANCGAYQLPQQRDAFAPQEVALGERCTPGATEEPCAKGLLCVDLECAEPLAKGATCSVSNDGCGTGLFCSLGVCESVAALGQPCTGIGRGKGSGCVAGLSCVPTDTNALTNDKVCAELQAAGEPCSRPTDCASRSCPSNTCVACTTDASCGTGGRCNAGECSTVFAYCGEDPNYFER